MNLKHLSGLDARIQTERTASQEHQKYLAMIARAVASGELPPNYMPVKRIAIPKGLTTVILNASGLTLPTDYANLQKTIDSAAPGDTVYLNDGSYLGVTQLRLKTGVKLTCGWTWGLTNKDGIVMNIPIPKAWIKWDNMPKGTNWAQKECFAILVPANSSNITIEGLGLSSNNGVFFLEGNSQNIAVLHCDGRWGWAGNYYSRHFMYTPGPINTFIVEENYLHGGDGDGERSGDRNCELWGVTNLQYNYNIFYNINDGGHLMNLGPNCSYSFNYGRRLHRMAVEVQQDSWPGPIPKNFIVEGNVFYDWDRPFWDSMLMSIPSVSTTDIIGQVTVKGNYLRGNAWKGLWGDADSSGKVRGSYGIETPQRQCLVTQNIIGGERMVGQLVRPGGNADCIDNRCFGEAPWFGNKAVGNEPGSEARNGKDQNNTLQPFSQMPPPPVQPRKNNPTPIPLPESEMQITGTKTYTSYADINYDAKGASATKPALLQWRGGDGAWRTALDKAGKAIAITVPITGVVTVYFQPPGNFTNWWVWFRLVNADGASPEVKAEQQIGKTADPTPPPASNSTLVDSSLGLIKVPVNPITGKPDFSQAVFA